MTDRYYLGSLCKNGHEWNGTGKSLRIRSSRNCLVCHRDRQAGYRRANPNAHREAVERHKNKDKEAYLARRRERASVARLNRVTRYQGQITYDGAPCPRGHTLRYVSSNACYFCQHDKYARNADQIKQYQRRYQEQNRDVIRQRRAKYRQTPKAKALDYRRKVRRRARRMNNPVVPYSPSELKEHLAKFYGCFYCGTKARLEADHVLAIARGGEDSLRNIVAACRICNASKGDRDVYQWYAEQRKVSLSSAYFELYFKFRDYGLNVPKAEEA